MLCVYYNIEMVIIPCAVHAGYVLSRFIVLLRYLYTVMQNDQAQDDCVC